MVHEQYGALLRDAYAASGASCLFLHMFPLTLSRRMPRARRAQPPTFFVQRLHESCTVVQARVHVQRALRARCSIAM